MWLKPSLLLQTMRPKPKFIVNSELRAPNDKLHPRAPLSIHGAPRHKALKLRALPYQPFPAIIGPGPQQKAPKTSYSVS